jgi:hypothetical protein
VASPLSAVNPEGGVREFFGSHRPDALYQGTTEQGVGKHIFLEVRPLRRTRLAFTRRIPGLKSETWGTLRVSRAESVWTAQGLGRGGKSGYAPVEMTSLLRGWRRFSMEMELSRGHKFVISTGA